jgi:hypothetical protein
MKIERNQIESAGEGNDAGFQSINWSDPIFPIFLHSSTFCQTCFRASHFNQCNVEVKTQ